MTPSSGILFTENGAIGIAFTVEQAAALFAEYQSLPSVLCVSPPRCEYVDCTAKAVAFFKVKDS